MGIKPQRHNHAETQTAPLNHEYWMRQALLEAKKAEQCAEVPVGAIIVKDGRIIGKGHNQPILTNDPTAHAEIIALRDAGQSLKNYRLVDTTLYVTLEPCLMCMGAILNARLDKLVFGATDSKRGAVCSALQLSHANFSNHHVEWESGVLETHCSQLLSEFFQARR